jgi:hypothetical protein
MAFSTVAKRTSGPRPRRSWGFAIYMTFVVVALAAWLYSKPFFAVKAMRTAAAARDMESLSRHIDMQALQENFRDLLRTELREDSAASPEDAFIRAFVGVVSEDVADMVVTPELVASLLIARPVQPVGNWAFGAYEQSPEARAITQRYRDTTAERIEADSTEAAMGRMSISMAYRSLNSFVVRVSSPLWQNGTFALELRRYGIATWKLAAMTPDK